MKIRARRFMRDRVIVLIDAAAGHSVSTTLSRTEAIRFAMEVLQATVPTDVAEGLERDEPRSYCPPAYTEED